MVNAHIKIQQSKLAA